MRLLTQEERDCVIFYAGFESLLIVSILGRASNLANPDRDRLYDSSFCLDEAWSIQQGVGRRAGASDIS